MWPPFHACDWKGHWEESLTIDANHTHMHKTLGGCKLAFSLKWWCNFTVRPLMLLSVCCILCVHRLQSLWRHSDLFHEWLVSCWGHIDSYTYRFQVWHWLRIFHTERDVRWHRKPLFLCHVWWRLVWLALFWSIILIQEHQQYFASLHHAQCERGLEVLNWWRESNTCLLEKLTD